MKSGKLVLVLGMVILSMVAMLLGACAGPTTASKGTMQVYVTDAPPKGVTAIEIKASNVEAHMAGAADDQWVSLLKDPPVFDLVKAIGVNVLLGTTDVAAGKYTQVRLDITEVNVTVNGTQVKATVPSDKLRLVGEITIEEGKETPISLDFDAEKSIVLEGQNKVSLKPVVKLVVAKPGETLPTPTASHTATQAANAPLFLTVVEPADESVIGVNSVTIRGKTLAGAVVSVNGDLAGVDLNGNFSLTVTLEAGPNIFDIIATDDQDNEATAQLVVSFAP
jgi:hypothetical protein